MTLLVPRNAVEFWQVSRGVFSVKLESHLWKLGAEYPLEGLWDLGAGVSPAAESHPLSAPTLHLASPWPGATSLVFPAPGSPVVVQINETM